MSQKLLLAGVGFALVLAIGATAIGDDPVPVTMQEEQFVGNVAQEPHDYSELDLEKGGLQQIGREEVIICLKACKSACDRVAPPGPPRVACYVACVPFCWQFL